MNRVEANPEELSLLEEFLGEDWEQQLEATTTSSPASLSRQALCSVALQGFDYSHLPKRLAKEIVEMEEELKNVFPGRFYDCHCRAGPFLMHMGLRVSWKKGGLWTLERFVRHVTEEYSPEVEEAELLLFPNVEVSQPDLALLLLLPDSTNLYDSLPEVTITRVDFNLAMKSLQLNGFCESINGKRFFLKTILQTEAVFDDDVHMTTMLYEKEDQGVSSFITSAVFLPSLEESLGRLLAEEEDLEDMSDDSIDFTSAAFLPSSAVGGGCVECSGKDCLCSSCLNNLTFDDGEGDEEEEVKVEEHC